MVDVYLLRHGKNHLSTLEESAVIDPDHPDGLLPGEKARLDKNSNHFLNRVPISHCYSSPLPRAMETACLLQKNPALRLVIEDRLKEREPPSSHHPMTVLEWNALQVASYKNPFESLDNFESCNSHFRRARDFWSQLECQVQEGVIPDGSNVVVVSHGGTMEHILRTIYQGRIEAVSKVFATCNHGHFHQLKGTAYQKDLVWNLHGLNVPLGPH